MKITREELKDIILEETAALIKEHPELLDEVGWLRRMQRAVSSSDLAKKLRGNWDAATLNQMDDVDAVIRGEVSPFDAEGKRAASGAAKVVNGFVSRLNDVMLDFTDEMNYMLSSGDQNAFETFPGIKDNLAKIDNAITTAVTEAETALRELQSMMKGARVSPEAGGADMTGLTAQGAKRVSAPGAAGMADTGSGTAPLQARVPAAGSLEERIANEVAKLLGS
jgi:hypothetical protein